MEMIMTSFTAGLPTALTIWLALLALCVGGFSVLAATAQPDTGKQATRAPRREPRPARGPGRPRRRPTVVSATTEAHRYADEIGTAADRAGTTAAHRHAEWQYAQQVLEQTWTAYDAAERAARTADLAAQYPAPATPPTPAEFAARERYLHRAAYAAHLRGELDTGQLVDALSNRNGFDPRLHPFEQEAVLRRLGRDRLWRAYRQAAQTERAAWYEADRAAAAQRALDRAAAVALDRAARSSRQAASAPLRRRVGLSGRRLALR